MVAHPTQSTQCALCLYYTTGFWLLLMAKTTVKLIWIRVGKLRLKFLGGRSFCAVCTQCTSKTRHRGVYLCEIGQIDIAMSSGYAMSHTTSAPNSIPWLCQKNVKWTELESTIKLERFYDNRYTYTYRPTFIPKVVLLFIRKPKGSSVDAHPFDMFSTGLCIAMTYVLGN